MNLGVEWFRTLKRERPKFKTIDPVKSIWRSKHVLTCNSWKKIKMIKDEHLFRGKQEPPSYKSFIAFRIAIIPSSGSRLPGSVVMHECVCLKIGYTPLPGILW